MASHELVKSIEEYNTQLGQVSIALEQDGLDTSEKTQLEALQQDLILLLELTLDQFQQEKSQPQQKSPTQETQTQEQGQPHFTHEHNSNENRTEEEIRLEEELALFKSEIAELDGEDEEQDCSQKQLREQEEKEYRKETDYYDSYDTSTTSSNSCENDKSDSISEAPNTNSLLALKKKPSKGGFVKAWTEAELQQLEGAVVRAPYTEQWGGHTYHNALVMSVGSGETGEVDLVCPEVVVLFRQPTCPAMLPCRFYLSGTCHYAADGTCNYSHGCTVAVDSLRSYCLPDPSSLRVGCKVLCQHSSSNPTSKLSRSLSRRASSSAKMLHPDLWHPGTVDHILEVEQRVSVDCVVCGEVVECGAEEVVVLLEEEEEDADEREHLKLSDVRRVSLSRDSQLPLETEGGDDPRRSCSPLRDDPSSAAAEPGGMSQPQQWLMNPKAGRLGEWEKYTRGIGSQLMERMGYVAGSGLGRAGEGRVEPVPAYLYPVGVSLDRCMELRERSGGEDLLQVEKRLVKQQQQQELRTQREKEKLNSATTVFDIINNKLAGVGSGSSSKSDSPNSRPPAGGVEGGAPGPSLNVGRKQLQADTSRALNIKGYQLASRISSLQRQVDQLEESASRQGGLDRTAAEKIAEKLQAKRAELRDARTAEQRVTSEQHSRREAKKFAVF